MDKALEVMLKVLDDHNLVARLKENTESITSLPFPSGSAIVSARSRLFDEAFGILGPLLPQQEQLKNLAVVAVGGYGRRELAPNSDVDVLLLAGRGVSGQLIDHYVAWIDQMVYYLGHKSGKLTKSADEPHLLTFEDKTSLSDARFLFGNNAVLEGHGRALSKSADWIAYRLANREVIRKLDADQASLCTSSFNIKSGTGGLRHLQHLLWASDKKLELPDEVKKAKEVLLHVRAWLHFYYPSSRRIHDDKLFDTFSPDLVDELKNQFGPDSFSRLMNARKTIADYVTGKSNEELLAGIPLSEFAILDADGVKPKQEFGNPTTIMLRTLIPADKYHQPVAPEYRIKFEALSPADVKPDSLFLELFKQEGTLSKLIEDFMKSRVIDKLLSGFSSLYDRFYTDERMRHRDISMAGRVVQRLRNLEAMISGDITTISKQPLHNPKSVYDSLPVEYRTALKLALVLKDIPESTDVGREAYLNRLVKVYPELNHIRGIVSSLMREGTQLFETANSKEGASQAKIKRFVKSIGDINLLSTLMIYNCSILDYGTELREERRFSKSAWQKFFALYRTIYDGFSGVGIREYLMGGNAFSKAPTRFQTSLLNSLPAHFFRSSYLRGEPEQVTSTVYDILHSLECAVTAKRGVEDRLHCGLCFVSEDPTETGYERTLVIGGIDYKGFLKQVAGTCYDYEINIEDFELYTLSSEYPLAIDFVSVSLPKTIPDTEVNQHFEKFLRQLKENVALQKNIEQPPKDALKKIKSYDPLKHDKPTDCYVLSFVSPNVMGMLYAVSSVLTDNGANILSARIFRRPHQKYVTDTITFTAQEEAIPGIEAALGMKAS
jgi:hypothetical protein